MTRFTLAAVIELRKRGYQCVYRASADGAEEAKKKTTTNADSSSHKLVKASGSPKGKNED